MLVGKSDGWLKIRNVGLDKTWDLEGSCYVRVPTISFTVQIEYYSLKAFSECYFNSINDCLETEINYNYSVKIARVDFPPVRTVFQHAFASLFPLSNLYAESIRK